MIPRLLTIWGTIRSSLWALPLTMAFAAGILAYAALNTSISIDGGSAWFLYSGTAKQAPQFLSDLMSSMITMATLAISITMVVLTLAAQQLGPRLIRSFMSDIRTQASLGLFISTVVYLLLVLRSTFGKSDQVSNLAVSVGTVLVLFSLATLLLFVHHLASSIIADNAIARVGAQLDGDIARLLPKETENGDVEAPESRSQGAPLMLSRGGYVQAIDYNQIVNAATEAGAKVVLDLHTGQHVVSGSILGFVTPKKAVDEKFSAAVNNAFLLGSERSAVQDLEYSVHQLVEIAVRALSPGINDPYTALAALDRLTLSIAEVMKRGQAKVMWRDEESALRLVAQGSTFEGITDAAFHQIRQHGAGLPAILIRLTENIGQLLQQAREDFRPALEKHLELVAGTGKDHIADKCDLNDLQASVETAKKNTGRALEK